MHSWREMVKLLETVDRPGTVGYQADMAHSMLYTLGYNREEDRILPKDFDWSDRATLDAAYKKVADALRPWTLDFHVAQNDGTVFGSGDHAKTGRHVPVTDPNGKLDVVKHAGYWLRDPNGRLTKTMRHIRSRERMGSRGGRGGRCIVPGSVGSKASVRPSVTAVIMLIQRIWTGVTGSTKPNAIAARIVSASPPLVGKVQPMTFMRLS